MGRRKPFVCSGITLGAIMLFLLLNPPEILVGSGGSSERRLSDVDANVTIWEHSVAEVDLSCEAEGDAPSQCAAVLQCVTNKIAKGLLPEWSTSKARLLSEGTGAPRADDMSSGLLLTIWFGLMFGFFFSGTSTIANIPYNALGMEVTSDPTERAQVIGLKGSAGMLGRVLGLVGMLVLATFITQNLGTQASP
eukprot:6403305-Prymnesium_polylepis.1